jgi:hypothetical protein
MGSNLPPVLAAQSAFHPGPLAGFQKICESTNSVMIQNLLRIAV